MVGYSRFTPDPVQESFRVDTNPTAAGSFFAFEKLPLRACLFAANLPPTLAKSQVSSVRKNLKLHLVSVLKHPCSLEFQAQISTLLLDLGMPQNEIARSTPAPREPRKRPRHEQYAEGKKVKMGECRSVRVPPFGFGCRRFCLLCRVHPVNKKASFPLQSQP